MASTDDRLERVRAAMTSGHVRLDVVRLLHFGDEPQTQTHGVKVWESGETKGGNHKWVEVVLIVPSEGETIVDTLTWLGQVTVDG